MTTPHSSLRGLTKVQCQRCPKWVSDLLSSSPVVSAAQWHEALYLTMKWGRQKLWQNIQATEIEMSWSKYRQKEIWNDRNFSLLCLENDTTIYNVYAGVHSHIVTSQTREHSSKLKHNVVHHWDCPVSFVFFFFFLFFYTATHCNVFISSRAFVAMHSNECLLKTCFK